MTLALSSSEIVPAKSSMAGKLADRPAEKKCRASFSKLAGGGADLDARRVCAVILEVLAGVKTPNSAAESLGVSPPRYYMLESRALEGMLLSCQRRPRGPQLTPARESEKLKAELERTQRDCARLKALLRTAQRVVGLPAAREPKGKEASSAKKRRKRRPSTRALKVAKALRTDASGKVLEGTRQATEDAPVVKT
jgi:hypothetical protein